MRAQLAAVLLVSLLLHPALFWASATNPLIPHKKKVSLARAPTAPEHPEHQPIDMKHVRNQLEGLSESLYLRDRRPASEGAPPWQTLRLVARVSSGAAKFSVEWMGRASFLELPVSSVADRGSTQGLPTELSYCRYLLLQGWDHTLANGADKSAP
eukprot:scaffold266_cov391-Prasinococcus_capsulatus_cf.AAC.16